MNEIVAGFYKVLVGAILLMIVLSMITANLGWFGIIAVFSGLVGVIIWLIRQNIKNHEKIQELRHEIQRLEDELWAVYWQYGPRRR